MNAPVCPCRRPCSQAALNSPLFRIGEAVRFERGDVLWREGDPADVVVAVCTGTLRIGRGDTLLELVSRGGVVGEEAALTDAARATRCEVLAPGRGMILSWDALERAILSTPALSKHLLEISLDRSRRLAERLDELVDGSVEQRLARVTLRLADEMGLPDARGIFVPLRLSCGDLGRLARCRPETVTRTFTRWRQSGALETSREGMVVRDIAAIRRASGQVVEPLRRAANG